MSYGVALRNGVPFTLGTIAALCVNATTQWNPLSLWPDGIASPGMWMSPRTLTSEWQDYTGTTAVAVPGTVADSSNPVGLALDIRAGATVLTDPGNHMLQSTSAARPLMSARVNLLTYTENFSNAAWNKRGFGSPVSGQTDPLGGTTAFLITENDTDTNPAIIGTIATLAADVPQTYGVFLKATSPTTVNLSTNGIYVGSTVSLTTAWQFFEVTQTSSGTYGPHIGGFSSITRGSGIGIYVWHPQYELGSAATPYQSVPGNGSTYATAFPIFQKYDGVDDGMATATFAAGTLTSAMDCMIAVRRDSAAACVAGLYNGIADATKFFGMAESASGSGCVGSGAGTPTVWVDNAQLTGGTAVTRGTLHTALTVGDYHILEFRGLDLSTWTAAGFGLYTSYVFPGARGDILLYPSTASTEDKDAARQYLATYYGVTLP